MEMSTFRSAIDELESELGQSWPHIRAARDAAMVEHDFLSSALSQFTNSDSSIVAVGSLAREEVTPGSDIDWTLLLDGVSDPGDLGVTHQIRAKLDELKRKQPGREGVFGSLVSSHDLVHHIGGQDDTNSNTTVRILLLLESTCLGRSEAYERVLNNILFRYLSEDRGLWLGSGPYRVPRFLFNDVARYWRTMAVDFAYKQRSRQNEGFALRNLKLRMSRKLLFIAGMIACFECHLNFQTDEERTQFYGEGQVQPVIDLLRGVLSQTPLEILASAVLRFSPNKTANRKLFASYDEFLGMLASEKLGLAASGSARQGHHCGAR
jgi:predicted nucleotidyltransferase